MKPQFANVFNVSVNDNRSECCSTTTRPSQRD